LILLQNCKNPYNLGDAPAISFSFDNFRDVNNAIFNNKN